MPRLPSQRRRRRVQPVAFTLGAPDWSSSAPREAPDALGSGRPFVLVAAVGAGAILGRAANFAAGSAVAPRGFRIQPKVRDVLPERGWVDTPQPSPPTSPSWTGIACASILAAPLGLCCWAAAARFQGRRGKDRNHALSKVVACAFWESDTERKERELMELLLEHRPPEVKHRPAQHHHPFRHPFWDPEAELRKWHEKDAAHAEEKETSMPRALSDWWESMTRSDEEKEARARRKERLKAEREAQLEKRRRKRAAEAASALSEPVEIEDWGQQSERTLRSVVQSVASSWSAAVLGTRKRLQDARDAAGAAASAAAPKLPFMASGGEEQDATGDAEETKALRTAEEGTSNSAETDDGSSSGQNWFQELASKLPWVDRDGGEALRIDESAKPLRLPPGEDAVAKEVQPRKTEEANEVTPENVEASAPPWGADIGFPSSQWWKREEDSGHTSLESNRRQPPPPVAAAEAVAKGGAAEEAAVPFVAAPDSSASKKKSGAPPRPADDIAAVGLQEVTAEEAEVCQKEATAAPREAPPPSAPGMSEANLVVQVDIEPRLVEAEETKEAGVARLMAKPGGTILATLCMDGWEVNPIDEEKGLYEVLLPSVNYKMPGGSVSIPAPRFIASVRDTFVRNGEYLERLQGDLVLQNGQDILTVELGFPFRTSFTVSAAGWTRACIGSKGRRVSVSNHVEIGLQVPRVPGLESILQLFVKSYGTESTVQVAKALAVGADALPEDPLGDWMESAKGALLGSFQGSVPPAESEPAALSATAPASEFVAEPNLAAAAIPSGEAGTLEPERQAEPCAVAAAGADAVDVAVPAATSAIAAIPALPSQGQEEVAAEEEAEVRQKEASVAPREVPPPTAPGMADANLVVRVDIPPKLEEAEKSKDAGVARLMAKPGGTILATLCMDGWDVTPIDESKGLYEVLLPSVNYKVPGGSVSIPAPRFVATVRDTFVRDGDYEERLQGDLVLQNGKDILTVELGFLFRTSFSISAAGWTRACIGSKGGTVSVSNYVEIGLQVPKVPGLESILQFFVKSYGTESTVQVAKALAIGADELPEDPLGDLMESARDALLGPFKGSGVADSESGLAAGIPVSVSEPVAAAPPASGREAGERAQATTVEAPAAAANVVAGDADLAGADFLCSAGPLTASSEVQANVSAAVASSLPLALEEAAEESDERVVELESQAAPKEVAPPSAPGMADANLTVRVDIDPKLAEPSELQHEGVTRLMAQPGGDILALMATDGWEVNPIDQDKGLYEVLLPSVNYKVAGATVSIPAPRFVATVRDTNVRTGDYLERLQGDLVLQNGKDIVTVELGFPFRTTFSISAAGWCRACIGGEGNKVSVANYVEIGLQIPRVPGLESIMQFFVKSYGTESTVQVAEALAIGADKLPPDLAREFFESAKDAMSGLQKQMPALPSMGSASPKELEGAPSAGGDGTAVSETVDIVPKEAAASAEEEQMLPEAAAPAPPNSPEDATAEQQAWAAGAADGAGILSAAASPARKAEEGTSVNEAEEEMSPEETEKLIREDVEALVATESSAPTPFVPGFEDANMVVGLHIAPKMQEAQKTGADGVACLMGKGGYDLLASMDDGWVIKPVDESKGIFEMSLPAVEYEMSVAKVSIPPPRFLVTVREPVAKSGSYEERLQGDMVLQNGNDIFTVELKMPWRTTFSISAAGWTRARIGWSGSRVVVSNYVEVGLFLPSVPGLESTMRYFLKNYGNESSMQVAEGLARGADNLSPEAISVNNFFQSAKSAMSELPRFGGLSVDPQDDHAKPEAAVTKAPEPQVADHHAEDAALVPEHQQEEQEKERQQQQHEQQQQQQRPDSAFVGEAAKDAVLATDAESHIPAKAALEEGSDIPDEAPHPKVPGMEQANLVVRVRVDPKTARAATTQKEGVARLMAQPGGAILATMARDGWEVNAVEPNMGIYELLLPPVRFKVPMGVVSIPAPRFLATVRDTCLRCGAFEERLQGDLVLQNGEGILTVELGFPFRTTFSITAAGWARSTIGSEGDLVSVGNYIEIGLRVPTVPGLESIMQLFVKSYGNESTQQVADALARGADNIPLEADLSGWLAEAFGKMSLSLDASLHPKALHANSVAADASNSPSGEKPTATTALAADMGTDRQPSAERQKPNPENLLS